MATAFWGIHVKPWALAFSSLTPRRRMRFEERATRWSRRPTAAVVGLGLAAAAVAGTGSAYAYWSGTGSANGTVASGSLSVSVPTPTAAEAPSSSLIPGGAANVSVKVTNPNTFPVTVYQVAQTASSSITATNGCATTGVSFVTQTALSVSVPAGTTQVISLTNAAAMDASSSSTCQGTTFNIPVTVTVRK